MKEKNALLEEAVKFFQKEPGFRRLFILFIKNYYRLGRMGGSVKILDLKLEEKEALSGIMGRDYRRQNSAAVSLAAFQQALEKTRFAGIDLKELLEGYHGKVITTRAEEEDRFVINKNVFFQALYQSCSSDYGRLWLEHIQSKGAGTRGIHTAYEQKPELLYKQLENVLKAIEELSRFYQVRDKGKREERIKYERLPVFASRMIRDPHGFDLNTEQGRLLISALHFICSREDVCGQKGKNLSAEEVTELFGCFGLIRDDLLNFVTCAGLLAFKGDEKNPIPMWQSAWEEGTVLNVPLREIAKINRFEPAVYSRFQEKGENIEKAVFVVENSGVFSQLLDQFQEAYPPPLVCTHGQFKLAAFLMLDLLVKNGVVIYYSGDFDPEGLQMAQRLLQRYPQAAKLWRYTTEDYQRCFSEVALSQSRLQKLKSITHLNLLSLKEKMQAVKMAGYQEQIVPLLLEDMKSFIAEQA